MGKVCLSCGLTAPSVTPKPAAEALPPTCAECPTCPNCRLPLVETEIEAAPGSDAGDAKSEPKPDVR